MIHMQEDEFDQMKKTLKPEECKEHNFVKLYYLGSHSDYGCTLCGLKTLTPELFKKKK